MRCSSRTIRYRLFEAGLLAKYTDGGMVFWGLSDAGRAALSEARGE